MRSTFAKKMISPLSLLPWSHIKPTPTPWEHAQKRKAASMNWRARKNSLLISWSYSSCSKDSNSSTIQQQPAPQLHSSMAVALVNPCCEQHKKRWAWTNRMQDRCSRRSMWESIPIEGLYRTEELHRTTIAWHKVSWTIIMFWTQCFQNTTATLTKYSMHLS